MIQAAEVLRRGTGSHRVIVAASRGPEVGRSRGPAGALIAVFALLRKTLGRVPVLAPAARAVRRRAIWPLARALSLRAYLASHRVRKLHLGANDIVLDGWFNTDVLPVARGVQYLDARQPFPFSDCSFDYISGEHVIEHMTYSEGLSCLRECFRVLRPGGRLRLATPDLEVYVRLFAAEKTELQRRYIRYHMDKFVLRAKPPAKAPEPPGPLAREECFVINSEFRNWGHKFIYDEPTLRDAMQKAGFTGIVRFASGESADPELRGIERHGQVVKNEEMNSFETMVLEGAKPGPARSGGGAP